MQRPIFVCSHVAQTWLRECKFSAARVNLFECCFDEWFAQRINWCIDSPNSLEREGGGTSVFSNARKIAIVTSCDHNQTFTTPANADDSSRSNDFIQPTSPLFGASLRLSFMQSVSCAYKTFKTHNGRKRYMTSSERKLCCDVL